jgi:hypothetical protein
LPAEVIGGFIAGMANLAIRGAHSLMVEGGVAPITGIVTDRTLPVEVVGWLIVGMAGLTVRGASRLVIEAGLFPIAGVVTG